MSNITLTLGAFDSGTLRLAVDSYERVCHEQIATCRLANVSHGVWDDCLDSLSKIRRLIKQPDHGFGVNTHA